MTVLPRDSLIFSISFIFLKLQTGYVLQSFQLQNWKVGSKIKEDQEAKEEQEILRFFSFNSRGSTNHLVVQRFEGAFTDIQKSWAPCSHGCHRCPNFFTCGMKHGPSYGTREYKVLKDAPILLLSQILPFQKASWRIPAQEDINRKTGKIWVQFVV